MPKSKLKWKELTGSVGPAWDKDIPKLIHNFRISKGYKFHEITWRGTEFTIRYVK